MDTKYKKLRRRLNDLGYNQPLVPEAVPLVEKLLHDLIQTTESLQKYMTIAKRAIEERDLLQLGAEPYKCDNAKLVRECNDLHLALLHCKEDNDKNIRVFKKEISKLEKEKTKLENSCEKLKHYCSDLESQLHKRYSRTAASGVKPALRSKTTSDLEVRKPRCKIQFNKTLDMCDQRIHNLLEEINFLKEERLEYTEMIKCYKQQVRCREKEIERLQCMLEGGRPADALVKDCCYKDAEEKLEKLQDELCQLKKEKMDLEEHLRESVIKQHEAMKRALCLVDKNKQLEKELGDIDQMALSVEAECNSTVRNSVEKINRLQAKMHEITMQNQHFERELAELKCEKDQLRAEMECLKNEKVQLQNALENALEEQHRLSDKMKEYGKIEQDLNMEIDRLSQLSASQKRKLSEAEGLGSGSTKYSHPAAESTQQCQQVQEQRCRRSQEQRSQISQEQRSQHSQEQRSLQSQEQRPQQSEEPRRSRDQRQDKRPSAEKYLQEQLQCKSEEQEKLKQQLEQKEAQIAMLKEENERCKQKIQSVKQRSESEFEAFSTKSTLRKVEREKEMLECELRKLDEEKISLERCLREANEKYNEMEYNLQCELQMARETIQKLEDEQRDLLTDEGTKRHTINSLEQQVQQLTEELQNARAEANQNKCLYNQVKALHDEADRAAVEAQDTIAELQSQLSEASEKSKSLENNNRRLTEELTSLRGEVNSTRGSMEMVDREKDELLMKLDAKTERCSMLEEELCAKTEKLMCLEGRYAELQKKLSSIYDESAALEFQLRASCREIENLKKELDDVIREKECASRENCRLMAEIAAARADARKSSNELEHAHRQVEDLKMQLQDYVREVKKYEDALSQKEAERAELLEQFKDLSNKHAQLTNNKQSEEESANNHKVQLSATLEHVATLERKIEGHEAMVCSYEKQIKEMNHQMASMEMLVQELKRERNCLEMELDRCRECSSQLDKQKEEILSQLCSKRSEQAQMCQELEKLRGESTTLHRRVEREQTSCERVERLLCENRKEAVELKLVNQELLCEVDRLKKTVDELQEKIDRLEEHLDMYQQISSVRSDRRDVDVGDGDNRFPSP
ncbi:centrosomal protein of 135 kDa isoform X2 [Agrilus planipennis]|uniref:Centrosomal protein of 135 kDa isoform X2 n=1 Tax=Agrilus planipennis TaxID=224129 RepID=A0A7F5RGV2_AGRPL|nr:centrosomal protein of 135 kDa isoform X2 [Agrilus planipennis]